MYEHYIDFVLLEEMALNRVHHERQKKKKILVSSCFISCSAKFKDSAKQCDCDDWIKTLYCLLSGSLFTHNPMRPHVFSHTHRPLTCVWFVFDSPYCRYLLPVSHTSHKSVSLQKKKKIWPQIAPLTCLLCWGELSQKCLCHSGMN